MRRSHVTATVECRLRAQSSPFGQCIAKSVVVARACTDLHTPFTAQKVQHVLQNRTGKRQTLAHRAERQYTCFVQMLLEQITEKGQVETGFRSVLRPRRCAGGTRGNALLRIGYQSHVYIAHVFQLHAIDASVPSAMARPYGNRCRAASPRRYPEGLNRPVA